MIERLLPQPDAPPSNGFKRFRGEGFPSCKDSIFEERVGVYDRFFDDGAAFFIEGHVV